MRMFRAGVHVQFHELLATKLGLGKASATPRVRMHLPGACASVRQTSRHEARPDIGISVIRQLVWLGRPRHFHATGVDRDDMVATIDIRRKNRFGLAAKNQCHLHGDSP